MTTTDPAAAESPSAPRWQPLPAHERRVLGVLVEKAKTTPENYPLSLNALRSGCNQKSNRAPLMQLDEDQISEALDELRRLGAAMQVQSGGRIDRYRHLAYEWLGVDKVELAVMAELLLRGAQTVGELRGRAARMEPIADLAALRPVLDSLQAKGLIVYLTPPGRGAIVSHALYLDRETDKLRREAGAGEGQGAEGGQVSVAAERGRVFFATGSSTSTPDSPVAKETRPLPTDTSGAGAVAEQLGQLREEVAALRREFQTVRTELQATAQQLRRELDELNRQLGN